MKDNGFTLIELIVVIVIVAALSVTVGVSMTGMLGRQKDKELEEYISTIEEAACIYAEVYSITEDGTRVAIGDLIEEGLLKNTLTNPDTNEVITKYEEDVVIINWKDNEKSCNYSYSTS